MRPLIASAALLAGCYVSMPPSIPGTARPELPPDKFLDVDAKTVTVAESYTARTGEDCVKGTNDCIEHRERRTRDVDIRVASATVDGRPLTLREVAVASSPEFVRDTDHVAGLTHACKRGRILMSIGGTAIVAGLTMLQRGFDNDNPNRNLAIGGYAALGAGIVGLLGGWQVFGGQHCEEAASIFKRWSPVYEHPDDTKLTGEAAEMLEVLAKKFNADHGRQAVNP